MVKKKRKDTRPRKVLIYASVICLSWIIVGIGSASRNKEVCADVVTHFSNTADNMFLNKDTIEQVIKRANGMTIRSTEMGEINVATLEIALEQNPYVKTAEVYKDLTPRLQVDIELRKPIARVICLDGSSFYLDREFRKMRVVSSWVPNVPIVHGMIIEPVAPADKIHSKELWSLRELLLYIDSDKFFHSQISEVIVDAKGEVTLEPEIGTTQVLFGKPELVKEKFENLRLFYHEVYNKAGWDRYSSVNLKFKDKIYAKKKS